MLRHTRHALTASVLCFTLLMATATSFAQPAATYPSRPLRYVVGGSVGGGADSLARAIAQKLGEQWGQQVIVDNRAGGGGIVASEIVAKSPPDGYTLLMAFTSHVTNPSLYSKLSYDAVKDFAPITLVATIPNILVVHPTVTAESVPALVSLAKKKQLSFASTGSGASTHLAGVLFGHLTGTKLLHVPYKGAGPAITGVMSAETDMMFANMVSILPQVKSGKLRGLAVTGARRSAAAPELPTIAESGVPGYETFAWQALAGPKGLPRVIVDRINGDVTKIIAQKDMGERFQQEGMSPAGGTPQQLMELVRREIDVWHKVVVRAGIRVE